MAGFFKKLIQKFKDKQDLQKVIAKQNQNQADKVLANSKIQEEFNQSLKKSASVFANFVNQFSKEFKQVDQNFIDQLEEVLIGFDVGPALTTKIVEKIVYEIKYHNVKDPKLIKEIIVDQILINYIQDSIIDNELKLASDRTNVILIVGANGVGKTTTIAKLAYLIKNLGKSVLLVAGDTFRAGAIEQLTEWAKRLEIEIVLPQKYGQDPSSVIFSGLTKAKEQNYDVVICDTSGRLQNKQNLMQELAKIDKTIKRFDPTAPHETLLVLDATIGQSGLVQAEAFNHSSKISGLILTKVDSTSKGGIILAIKDAFNIPVKYVGYGEKITDLAPFNLEAMIDSLTDQLEWH